MLCRLGLRNPRGLGCGVRCGTFLAGFLLLRQPQRLSLGALFFLGGQSRSFGLACRRIGLGHAQRIVGVPGCGLAALLELLPVARQVRMLFQFLDARGDLRRGPIGRNRRPSLDLGNRGFMRGNPVLLPVLELSQWRADLHGQGIQALCDNLTLGIHRLG